MSAKLRFSKRLSVILVSLGLASAPTFAGSPAEHDHGHDHAGAPGVLTLDAGRKWATDEPLRKAMANIRGAMNASLHAIHEGKLPAAKYGVLAKKVHGEVGNMVSSCKLEPKADAQLHLIIAELLEGAETMAAKAKQAKRQDGAIKVLGALEHYGTYFDDPAWKPIKH